MVRTVRTDGAWEPPAYRHDPSDGRRDARRRTTRIIAFVLPPWLVALGLVLALLVLIPARRLQLAGVQPRVIGLYALVLWAFAMLVAVRPGATRVLVPFLLIAYIAPFVAAPDQVRRVLRRRPPDGRPPIKDVTPPDDRTDP